MQGGREWDRFTHGKQIPIADLLLFTSKEGDEATSRSFATENTAIDASRSSLEVLIATWCMQRGYDGEDFTHIK